MMVNLSNVNLTNELNVLIVDKNAYSRKEIKFALQANGVRNIFEVEDGQKALEVLKSKDQGFFDLIISEMQMQPMSGLELLEKVKSNVDYMKIPFAIISTTNSREEILKANSLKVDEYIIKPIIVDHFKTRIRKIIARKIEIFTKELKEFASGAEIAGRRGEETDILKGEERINKVLAFFEIKMSSLKKTAQKMKIPSIISLASQAEDLAYKAQFSEKRNLVKVLQALWDAASTIQFLFGSVENENLDVAEISGKRLTYVSKHMQVPSKHEVVEEKNSDESTDFESKLKNLLK